MFRIRDRSDEIWSDQWTPTSTKFNIDNRFTMIMTNTDKTLHEKMDTDAERELGRHILLGPEPEPGSIWTIPLGTKTFWTFLGRHFWLALYFGLDKIWEMSESYTSSTFTMEERIFPPRFKSAGFVNIDADVNDDEGVTVRTNDKSRAELNQWLGV